jgi:hypothetical protein
MMIKNPRITQAQNTNINADGITNALINKPKIEHIADMIDVIMYPNSTIATPNSTNFAMMTIVSFIIDNPHSYL